MRRAAAATKAEQRGARGSGEKERESLVEVEEVDGAAGFFLGVRGFEGLEEKLAISGVADALSVVEAIFVICFLYRRFLLDAMYRLSKNKSKRVPNSVPKV